MGQIPEVVEQCGSSGWKAHLEPAGVGCRGFAGRSLLAVYKLLGITGAETRKSLKSAMGAAERLS